MKHCTHALILTLLFTAPPVMAQQDAADRLPTLVREMPGAFEVRPVRDPFTTDTAQRVRVSPTEERILAKRDDEGNTITITRPTTDLWGVVELLMKRLVAAEARIAELETELLTSATDTREGAAGP